MKLEFKKIEIHSFMSFEDEVFDFSANDGMTLIKGVNYDLNGDANGAGKSQLGNSLLYVLFGQLQTKIKNENVVNRYAKDKDMRLVLTFDVDNKQYKIVRGMNKGKSSYLNLYSIENNVDVDLTKSSIAETQDFLEKEIIHCDISIFLRTILLTADQTYNFYTLKKNDKKEFVEKLFDISIFGDMYQALHKDLLVNDKSIVSHQNQLLVLNKNNDDYNSRSVEFESNKKKNILVLNEKMQTLNKNLIDLNQTNVQVNESLVAKVNDAIEKITNGRQTIANDIKTAAVEKSKIQLGIQKLQSDKISKQKELKKHETIVSKLCDDCKEVFKKHYNIQTYDTDIKDIDSKIEKLNVALDKSIEKEKNISKKDSLYVEKLNLAKNKLKDLTKAKTELDAKLQNINNSISLCQNSIDNENNSKNPYVSMIDKNAKSIEDETKLLDSLENKHNYLKFAENIVSQDTLRKFIIRDLISLLNNKIRMYLTKLGAKYYVLFNDDMDYEFIPTSGTCEFGNFSAGERMRLMIATSFAFRDFMSIRNGLNANVLFLDEYFDSAISSQCVESIIQILSEYKENLKQNIYVISHRKEVSIENFNRVVQIEKRNDISKITFL